MVVAEMTQLETCSLVTLLALALVCWAICRAITNIKTAASTTWTTVGNNPVARVGIWYFLRNWLR